MTIKKLIEMLKGFDENSFVVSEIGEPVETAVLLTKEQRDIIYEKRRMIEYQLARLSDLGPQADNWALDVLKGIRDIFSIIDSLQPKQYTKDELLSAVHSNEIQAYEIYEDGIIDCARFLGALKE